jgi:adenylate cyclase
MGEALRLYQAAITKDPAFADAYAADAYLAAIIYGGSYITVLKKPEARQRAVQSIARALQLSPGNAEALRAKAGLESFDGDLDTAIATSRRLVTLHPGKALAHGSLSWTLMVAGFLEESLREIEAALRLDPKPSVRDTGLAGDVLFQAGQYERAIEYFTDYTKRARKSFRGYTGLIIANAQLGRLDEAKTALAKIFKTWPGYNVRFYSKIQGSWKKEVLEHRLNAMRKGGVPEWPHGFKGAPADRLDGPEIKAVFFGRIHKGTHSPMVAYVREIDKDGNYAYRAGNWNFTGSFVVEGDLLCVRPKTKASGVSKNCYHVYRNPSGTLARLNQYTYANTRNVYHFSPID